MVRRRKDGRTVQARPAPQVLEREIGVQLQLFEGELEARRGTRHEVPGWFYPS